MLLLVNLFFQLKANKKVKKYLKIAKLKNIKDSGLGF
jgi:hypothetical protein